MFQCVIILGILMMLMALQILEIYENKEKKRDIKIQEALPIDELIPKENILYKPDNEIESLANDMASSVFIKKKCPLKYKNEKDCRKSTDG